MAKKAKIVLPVAPLADLMLWWRDEDIAGIVIGGLAVALLGRPRVTRDIDALILLPEKRWKAFLRTGRSHGFTPRFRGVLAFARESHVLLVRHQATGIDIDIALCSLPFEQEAISRAKEVRVAGTSVPLATPEDLVIMKAVSHRDRDLLDIEGLLLIHSKLDIRRMRRWTRLFAAALEMPEIVEHLEGLLKCASHRSRGKDG